MSERTGSRPDPWVHGEEHDALAVGWALYALDEDEAAVYERHLAGCVDCRALVDETTATFGVVAEGLAPQDPPPALRERVLEAVAAEPRGEVVVPLAPRRRAPRWVLAAAAAAVVVVVVAVGGLTVANQRLRAERDAAADRAQRDAVVVDILRDAGTPGVAHATLADPQGALVGLVVDDGHGPRVMTTGLPANGADEVYVLWGLVDGTPSALGTFDVGGSGPTVASVPSSAGPVPYGAFAVSLEPGHVAPASPTQVVASGQVGR